MSYELKQVFEELKNNQAVLVDVREKEEWAQGYIQGAILCSLSHIQASSSLKNELPCDKMLYLYCRSGQRSLLAKNKLISDFPSCVSLKEGFDDLESEGLLVDFY